MTDPGRRGDRNLSDWSVTATSLVRVEPVSDGALAAGHVVLPGPTPSMRSST